jgi:hypothetical protein
MPGMMKTLVLSPAAVVMLLTTLAACRTSWADESPGAESPYVQAIRLVRELGQTGFWNQMTGREFL